MIVVLDDTRKLLDGSYILTRIKFCIIWIIPILIRVLDMSERKRCVQICRFRVQHL